MLIFVKWKFIDQADFFSKDSEGASLYASPYKSKTSNYRAHVYLWLGNIWILVQDCSIPTANVVEIT